MPNTNAKSKKNVDRGFEVPAEPQSLPILDQEFFTLPQVAVLFGCSIDTVRRWVKLGKIKTVPLPGGSRVMRSEVERLFQGEEIT